MYWKSIERNKNGLYNLCVLRSWGSIKCVTFRDTSDKPELMLNSGSPFTARNIRIISWMESTSRVPSLSTIFRKITVCSKSYYLFEWRNVAASFTESPCFQSFIISGADGVSSCVSVSRGWARWLAFYFGKWDFLQKWCYCDYLCYSYSSKRKVMTPCLRPNSEIRNWSRDRTQMLA